MQIYKGSLAELKITQIIKAGKTKLHIVADFDGTLTPEFDSQGKAMPTGVALIRESNLLTPQYTLAAKELFEKYSPIEKDLNLDLQVKKDLMKEWWSKHLALMQESGINQDIIDKITQNNSKIFRDNTPDFFLHLSNLQIPTLILSAGIGNIIDNLMNQNGFIYGNIHIISNYFTFDSHGKSTYDENQIIHSFNKEETSLTAHPYSKNIVLRPNVILLGNNLGDAHMADAINTQTVLKIGFLDKPKADNSDLDAFLKIYDIVLIENADLSFVNDILEKL